ncbi:MAG: CDP-glycerol glycerophosphotransferase family protein [Bifidobacteriaceae bacterium]|jgi:hypothetical protein|nr:CDP-glycerol glycerophosphotransferase family protein [Bifidobacteriaceae bacterium]
MSEGRAKNSQGGHLDTLRAVISPNVLAARALKAAVAAARWSGLLPRSIPDGRGDERRLARQPVKAQVIVYFADTVVGLYQLRPWYKALRELHRVHPLVIIGNDSRAARAIRRESHLPAYTISHYSSIDPILSASPVRLALYINHNAANFSLLAFTQLVHVSIMHGDSDKAVSVSGQTKAYDFTFVAGQAAIDRLAAYLPMFDASSRCRIIGRPQVESSQAEQPVELGAVTARWTVLYAPTWEGGTDSAAYSSLAAYGQRIVASLLSDDRFRVIYRPHPLTGTRRPAFAEADAEVRRLVEAAAKADPAAGHRLSLGGDVARVLSGADALISDVSSLAIDFLVTGRPLTVTVPPDGQVRIAPTRLLELTPRLDESQAGSAADLIAGLIEEDPAAADRAALTEYYLGDIRPGAAVKAFIEACGQMIELAEANRGQLERPGAGQDRPTVSRFGAAE